MLRRAPLIVVAVVVAAGLAFGQSLSLDAVDSGNYDWTGDHGSSNQNYIAGSPSNGYYELRNFVVFDLAGVTGPVTAATLELYNPGQVPDGSDGFTSADPTETYTVYEVTTPVATLVAGGTGLTAVFDDLGAGVLFGSVEVSAADNGAIVQVPLNPDAVAAINAAGGLWAVGGALTTITGTRHEYVFGSTNGSHVRRLVLETGDAIFADGFESGSASPWSTSVP